MRIRKQNESKSKGTKRKHFEIEKVILKGDFVNARLLPHYPQVLLVFNEGTRRRANTRRGNMLPRLGLDNTHIRFSTGRRCKESPYVFVGKITNPVRQFNAYQVCHKQTIEQVLTQYAKKIKVTFDSLVHSIPIANKEEENDIVEFFTQEHDLQLYRSKENIVNTLTECKLPQQEYIRFDQFNGLRNHPDPAIGMAFILSNVKAAKNAVSNLNKRLNFHENGIYLTNPVNSCCIFIQCFKECDFSTGKTITIFLRCVAEYLKTSTETIKQTIDAIKLDADEKQIIFVDFKKRSEQRTCPLELDFENLNQNQVEEKESETVLPMDESGDEEQDEAPRPKKRARINPPNEVKLASEPAAPAIPAPIPAPANLIVAPQPAQIPLAPIVPLRLEPVLVNPHSFFHQAFLQPERFSPEHKMYGVIPRIKEEFLVLDDDADMEPFKWTFRAGAD